MSQWANLFLKYKNVFVLAILVVVYITLFG